MKFTANAKINLHLAVGPRRRDGYHRLSTLFQEISLGDVLTFQPTRGPLSLSIKGRRLSAGPDNLVLRALEMLRGKLGTSDGMRVTLEKNIPMGAGLGGGSSDAAAALLAGYRIWTKKTGVPPVLKECARRLGADVSFFLKGGRAWARGIGDKLRPVRSYKKEWLVLIYPRVHVATAKAYAWLDDSRLSLRAKRSNLLSSANLGKDGLPRFARNDFESVVLPRFPQIRAAKAALIEGGCSPVLMSGSGASVFGVVKNRSAGQKIKQKLRANKWDIYLVKMI